MSRTLVAVVVTVLAVSLAAAGPAAAAAPNDSRAAAQVVTVPATVQGTTVGSTLEYDDPYSSCGPLKGSVWYAFTATRSRSLLLALLAAGDMDATVEIFSRVRSQLTSIGCSVTDQRGEAVVDVDVAAGTDYLIRVGPLWNSVADAFTLRLVAPDEPATAPGDPLPASGVVASVDRFANQDDAWSVDLVGGRTYRLNFVTSGDLCARVDLFPPGTTDFTTAVPLRERYCDGHTVFTAEETGRYSLLVRAPRATRVALPYRLAVGVALADDTAPGVALAVDTDTPGQLRGSVLDALDLYRFGVAHRSLVRVRLQTEAAFELTVMRAGGGVLGTSSGLVELQLTRGHYYVAVRSLDGADGSYVLRRHSRVVTSARMLVNGHGKDVVRLGHPVTLTLRVRPAVAGPSTFLLERLDPIDGWLFSARMHPAVVDGRAVVVLAAPGLGRWRVTGTFRGTYRASPSEGGTAGFSVVEPLSLSALAP